MSRTKGKLLNKTSDLQTYKFYFFKLNETFVEKRVLE